jgi:protocatechuate 3,4-dioxygenase beta subunit
MLTGAAATLASGAAVAAALTPAQTPGPFYPKTQPTETDVDLTLLEGHTERAAGDVILVRGRILDRNGNPLANARVDIWQTNHFGRYDHPDDRNPAPLDPNFQGFGVCRTDSEGQYGFRTIRPAPYPLDAMNDVGMRPRHIHFKVAHEDAGELTTQMYFAGDPLIEDDVVMRDTPEDQRHLLITEAESDAETSLPLHRFDITLG